MLSKTKVKKLKSSEIYSEIENDLREQLTRNETKGKYYENLVSDYMDMWISKELLIDDIQKRGVSIKYNNGGGQEGYTKNPSVELMNKTNAQMLKLLKELGIDPSQSGDSDDKL